MTFLINTVVHTFLAPPLISDCSPDSGSIAVLLQLPLSWEKVAKLCCEASNVNSNDHSCEWQAISVKPGNHETVLYLCRKGPFYCILYCIFSHLGAPSPQVWACKIASEAFLVKQMLHSFYVNTRKHSFCCC